MADSVTSLIGSVSSICVCGGPLACTLSTLLSQVGVENIDIGGPAMIRGAAKNMAHVTVAVDPADYPEILEKLGKVGVWWGGGSDLLAGPTLARAAMADLHDRRFGPSFFPLLPPPLMVLPCSTTQRCSQQGSPACLCVHAG
jgi:hypothetical protein